MITFLLGNFLKRREYKVPVVCSGKKRMKGKKVGHNFSKIPELEEDNRKNLVNTKQVVLEGSVIGNLVKT